MKAFFGRADAADPSGISALESLASPDSTSGISGKKSARVFLQASSKLRALGKLVQAEKVCARGTAIYPSDLSLAIEHAGIAQIARDERAKMTRWQRVLDLAGTTAPVEAYRHLAESHNSHGAFDEAERILRHGLEIHPADFSLMKGLAGTLSACGRSAAALAAWSNLIEAHPDRNHAVSYLRMSSILREEGMIDRAQESIRAGLAKYPDDIQLQDSAEKLSLLRYRHSPSPIHREPLPSFTDHLFTDRYEPFEKGTLGFSSGTNAFRQHVPAMLDFAKTISPLRAPGQGPSVDIFATWGVPSDNNASIAEMAAFHGKPLLCLDSGFLSSPGIEGKTAPAHSVVICPDSIYFDATKPSHLVQTLNSAAHELTESQRSRTQACIETLLVHRISKYNHAPRIDMRSRFSADATKRVLLVDQRIGGGSIHWSLGGRGAFERMWEAALALPDHEILVKLHPEIIAGNHQSHLLSLAPSPLPANITIVDFDVNPFDLFDIVGKVFVCTSQLGFEAAMAGKEVHCFGAPFYSGWGFTQDRIAIPSRKRRRTINEVFHLFYIVHSRYFVPGQVGAEIEDLIAYLADANTKPTTDINETEVSVSSPSRNPGEPLKILIVIPSGRFGATGRYLQNLSVSLVQSGCEVMILAEGPCQPLEFGVRWLTLEFDGLRLAESVRRTITDFAPQIIYENGVRSRSQRAALEAVVLTGARFAMQSEDDDIQIHRLRQGDEAAEHLAMLDHAELTGAEIVSFLSEHDWNYSLRIFLDPGFNRWIEPLLRTVCYRMASLHTAIWHPFAERLAREYEVPTLVVPPVASNGDFERIPLTREERDTVLRQYGIDPSNTVIFIGGALYDYSGEYAVFLTAINLAAKKSGAAIALVIATGRSNLPIMRMARETLGKEISMVDLGDAGDEIYIEMLKACDVVCSPGLPDTFNRYRLPSRLVKAMAMGKPILTCRCGFGESLEHNVNAFLMDGEDPAVWADSIIPSLDSANRAKIGSRGRIFAREHFDSPRVAAALKHQFESILKQPPRTLATGITFARENHTASDGSQVRMLPSIKLRNRYHSSMQFAIRAVASLTHRVDTVVHLGAGRCDEFEDYCRLGAHTVLLVEALEEKVTALRELENTNGRILVKQKVVSGISGRQSAFIVRNSSPKSERPEDLWLLQPDRLLEQSPSTSIACEPAVTTSSIAEVCEGIELASEENNLLLLELNGAEAAALATTPRLLLQKFRWIALRAHDLPLCRGGSTPEEIHHLLGAAGYASLPVPANHAGPDVLLLYQRLGSIPS